MPTLLFFNAFFVKSSIFKLKQSDVKMIIHSWLSPLFYILLLLLAIIHVKKQFESGRGEEQQ